MPRHCLLAWALVLLLPTAATAQTPSPAPAAAPAPVDPAVKEVRDCLRRNIPKKSSVQTVHFTSTDRIGGQREFRGKILGMRVADGSRRAKICISQPPEMRGSEVLSMETPEGAPDTFLFTTELRKPKRITGEGVGGSLFGTDFTYEDMQRWQQLNRPERHARLPDAEVDGRPVYVMETVPTDEGQSAYAKVLSYVDKKTCVVIKSESFESGDRLRRVMTSKPEQMLEDHEIFAPTEVVMRDVRDETSTTVVVEDFQVDSDTDERSFQVSSLGRHCR
jgi:Outer membrane lipoprotein-sorting protein